MREIKFRAIFDGKIVEYIKWQEGNWMYSEDNLHWYFEKKYAHSAIQEYTGLKDKNGVEIYEGDILRREKVGVIVGLESGLVHMLDSEYRDMQRGMTVIIYEAVADNQTSGYLESCEVIGNIWENPELLTNKQ